MQRKLWFIVLLLPVLQMAAQERMQRAVMPAETLRHVERARVNLRPEAAAWVLAQARAESQKREVDVNELRSAVRQRFAGALNQMPPLNAGIAVDELVALVMTQLAADSDKDLEEAMKQAEAVNKLKQQMRNEMQQLAQEQAAMRQHGETKCVSAICSQLREHVNGINMQIRQAAEYSVAPNTIHNLQVANVNRPRPIVPIYAPDQNSVDQQQLEAMQNQMKNSLDSMNEMSEMESMRMQMVMDRRSKMMETLSNILKKLDDISASIVQNMK